jgi:sigma-B regulation protein RsbU (phosphoserine phosphatase)
MTINEKIDYDVFNAFSPIALVISNGEGIILDVNPKTEQLFGFEPGELIGKPIECLMPEDLMERHIEHRTGYYAKPFSRAMGAGLELVGRKKDGDLFPIEIGLSYSQDGDAIRVISYILDITQRVQSEKKSQAHIETQKKDTEREFQLGHQTQISLLPKVIPHIPGWSLAIKWLPANEIGGDFYDVILRKDGGYDLLIADVTDKGISAAIFMAFSNTLLRASLNGNSSLQEGIGRTNQLICQDSSQGLYVTLFVTRINPKKGEISFVNAGHNPPLHYSNRNGQFSSLTQTGLPLGIDPQSIYEQQSVQIDPMDFIVFYTDGVTEARNAEGMDFGIERLRQVILKHRNATTEEMANSISKAVYDFTGPDTLKDDVTIMVAKRE